MKKIIAFVTALALAFSAMISVPPVKAASSNTASNLTYKEVAGGFYFVGYEDVKLEKGKSYAYTINYKANVVNENGKVISGQNANYGLFEPHSSGAPVNTAIVNAQNGSDVAAPGNDTFEHKIAFTAKEDGVADIGVYLFPGSVLQTTPDATLIWLSASVNGGEVPSSNTAPVINASDKEIQVGDKFDPKADVTATDKEDGDLTSKIAVTKNEVDTSKAGVYDVSYSVTDSGNLTTTKAIKVTVKENPVNTAPTIQAEDRTIGLNANFDPLENVTATDKEDGDLTSKIVVTQNEVDSSKAGSYKVSYKVTDSAGLSAEKTITVTVLATENEAPVINATDKTIKVGDKFDPKADVTATDKEDGDLTSKIEVVKNEVDASKAGSYKVTYRVIDSAGIMTEKTITVTVKDGTIDLVINGDATISGKISNDSKAENTAGKQAVQTKSDAKKMPKTGDTTMIWLVLAGALLVTGASIAIYRRQSAHK
ncbi:immunoglobulin-like domain-containing protein [Listeria costaricensis]|uniref:LPXTG cell wall anchor domain-containing protein n=1 Tax=Listeria costaricensis TaxID=2026604 RepID=UPI000C074DF2|nr:immunoglobulin-like domain-containing protein [Listeria costaricensis]